MDGLLNSDGLGPGPCLADTNASASSSDVLVMDEFFSMDQVSPARDNFVNEQAEGRLISARQIARAGLDGRPREMNEDFSQNQDQIEVGPGGPSLNINVSFDPPLGIPNLMNPPTSTISYRNLHNLRALYHIPSDVGFRVPLPGEDPGQPPPGEVAFCPVFFECGLRLPLQPFVKYMLQSIDVAPIQLGPNFWKAVIGCYILWKELDFPEFSMDEFMYLYHLKLNPAYKDCYLACCRKNRENIITGITPPGPWMSKWFFVFGNWEASPSEGVNPFHVLTHYRFPVRWDRFDNLPKPLLRQIEGAKTFSRDRRSVEYLLSPQVLFHHGFIPTLPSSGGSALAETPRKRGLPREPYDSRNREFMALANARRAWMALPSSVESPALEAGPNAAGSEDFISTGSFSHLQGFLENAARIVPGEEPMDIQK